MVIAPIRGLITPFITTHEPPSKPSTLYPYRIPIDPFKVQHLLAVLHAHQCLLGSAGRLNPKP